MFISSFSGLTASFNFDVSFFESDVFPMKKGQTVTDICYKALFSSK